MEPDDDFVSTVCRRLDTVKDQLIWAALVIDDQPEIRGRASFGPTRTDRTFAPEDSNRAMLAPPPKATLKRLDTGGSIETTAFVRCGANPTHWHFDFVLGH
jgi:hypothetical protein